VGIIVLFGVALVAIVTVLAWFAARDIFAGRQDELRTVVEVASKVAQQQYDEFKNGTISEAEAQQRAKASIRSMRYNTNDYLFVYDKDLVAIVLGPRPELEGKDLSMPLGFARGAPPDIAARSTVLPPQGKVGPSHKWDGPEGGLLVSSICLQRATGDVDCRGSGMPVQRRGVAVTKVGARPSLARRRR